MKNVEARPNTTIQTIVHRRDVPLDSRPAHADLPDDEPDDAVAGPSTGKPDAAVAGHATGKPDAAVAGPYTGKRATRSRGRLVLPDTPPDEEFEALKDDVDEFLRSEDGIVSPPSPPAPAPNSPPKTSAEGIPDEEVGLFQLKTTPIFQFDQLSQTRDEFDRREKIELRPIKLFRKVKQATGTCKSTKEDYTIYYKERTPPTTGLFVVQYFRLRFLPPN